MGERFSKAELVNRDWNEGRVQPREGSGNRFKERANAKA